MTYCLSKSEYGNVLKTCSQSTIPTLVIRDNGAIIDANKAMTDLTGYTPGQLPYLDLWISRLYPQAVDRQQIADAIRRLSYVYSHVIEKPLLMIKKNRHRRFVRLSVYTIFENGKPTELCALQLEDIGEFNRLWEALQALEQRYENLTSNIGLGIVKSTIGPPGKFLEVNSAMEKITGYSREELLSMDVSDLYMRPSERERILAKAISAGGKVSREVRFKKKGNTEIVVSVTKIAVEDTAGKIRYFDGTIEDITKRRETDAALIHAEEKCSKVFRCIPDPISIATLESGKLIEVNDAFVRLIGYSREETIGRTTWDIDFWDKPESRNSVTRMLEERGSVRDIEIQYRAKQGDIRLGLFSADAIDLGIEPCWICTVKDITQRKLAEDALMESERFSRTLLVNSPNPVIVIEPDTSINYVNPALTKLTGFSSRDLLGTKAPYPWWSKHSRHQTSADLLGTLRKRSGKYEDTFRNKKGELFWVDISYALIETHGRLKYYLGNWVDVTDRKRLKENMQFYITEVTKVQEEERKRIARELHDGPAQMLAALSIDVYKILGDDLFPKLGQQQMKILIANINNVHDEVCRISQELRPGLLEKIGLISSLGLLMKNLEERANLCCTITTKGIVKRLAPEAEVLLFRIAQEAMNNIRKHSKATDVSLCIRYEKNVVKLTIDDNGTGFELPHDIGDFARNSKLGIIGMHERIQLLNGKLTFMSYPGKGTTVKAEIPTETA